LLMGAVGPRGDDVQQQAVKHKGSGKSVPGVQGSEVLVGPTKIYGSDAADAQLEPLQSGAENLRGLVLSNTKITDKGLKHLKNLADLQTLLLSNTKVTDTGLRDLEPLIALKWLDLKATQITDAGLSSVRRLNRLERLSLEGNSITDKGLEQLRELATLR